MHCHSKNPSLPQLSFLILASLALIGCDIRDPRWRSYEEINISERPTRDAMPRPEARPSSASRAPLKWTRPESWQEQPGSGMRLATLSVSNDTGLATCTFVSLSGAAGGLEANVRRWIGQLDIEPPAPDALSAFLERQPRLTSDGGFEGTLVDLTELGPTADGSSMLAAIFSVNGSTLFVKMTGPLALLTGEKDRFTALCQSLRTEP